MTQKILVIRLGALGDLALCMGAFSAVRRYHPDAEIALLTGPSFEGFARDMPWFDRVLVDPRPRFSEPLAWLKLAKEVRGWGATRVYDFQGKTRQSVLYALLGGFLTGPEWSGAAPFCSHPRLWPPCNGMHYNDFLTAQLQRAGIVMDNAPDLGWLDAPIEPFNMPERFALLIPGCAPDRLYKRWPAESYAALASRLGKMGLSCAAIGTRADKASIEALRALAPEVVDLSEKTSLKQIAGLARKAVLVVGNDTGPTHLAASVGAKTVALMSDSVDPRWSSPKGPRSVWIQGKPLASIEVEEVVRKAGL